MQVGAIDKSVRGKNIIKELCYKGEREREREREREIYGRGETRINDSEGVRREKVRELTVKERLFFKKKNLKNNL